MIISTLKPALRNNYAKYFNRLGLELVVYRPDALAIIAYHNDGRTKEFELKGSRPWTGHLQRI